jgi:hypothetical protein
MGYIYFIVHDPWFPGIRSKICGKKNIVFAACDKPDEPAGKNDIDSGNQERNI